MGSTGRCSNRIADLDLTLLQIPLLRAMQPRRPPLHCERVAFFRLNFPKETHAMRAADFVLQAFNTVLDAEFSEEACPTAVAAQANLFAGADSDSDTGYALSD